jgi:hypothetical protein
MPTTPGTQATSTVTATYKSGLKLDGAWHSYSPSCPRIDVRPGDKVRCSLDEQGSVTAIEIVERGQGILPPDTISEGQKTVLAKILDDREQNLQSLEERFLVPFKGKRLAELTKLEGGLLLDFFFGRRKPSNPGGRGFRR